MIHIPDYPIPEPWPRPLGHLLGRLPEPYRTQALEYLNTQPLHPRGKPSWFVHEALFFAFVWADTREGRGYWSDLCESITPRTIAEWLEALPEPWRSQALDNLAAHGFGCADDEACGSGAEAIDEAFEWASTPEGVEYWRELVERLR